MDNLYKTGGLTLEMLEKAREVFSNRFLGQERMYIGFNFDMLRPPVEEGERIFGGSLLEYEAVLVDGNLQWQATGKTAIPAHIVG